MIKLARLTIYPVKSFDGIDLPSSRLTTGGALVNDRRFALVDLNGRFINGKGEPRLHRLRATFDESITRVTLTMDGQPTNTFSLENELTPLCQWLSRAFERDIALTQNTAGGFPDDTLAPGPTIISTATLETVASWFDLSLEEIRRRFRANLEIVGVPPFWEDQLYTTAGRVSFRLGDAIFAGHNPCQRCAVPTRDSLTGDVNREFTKIFNQRRADTLPAWVPKERFDHFYRLSVNTSASPDQVGKSLAVGEELEILGPIPT